MFYVTCPECGLQVEIPADAVGFDRTAPWNVAGCEDCGVTFDYDDHEVATDERSAS